MSAAPYLDADILRRILSYDPNTGDFTWRHRSDVSKAWNTKYAGKIAGYDWKVKENLFYRSIRIFDWPFLGHRLAVLYVTGDWPVALVDHKDCNGLNNRWDNLRPATHSQNLANVRKPKTNTTGFKGVALAHAPGLYRATIKIDGKQKWLGLFESAEEAHKAYVKASLAKNGEFARSE